MQPHIGQFARASLFLLASAAAASVAQGQGQDTTSAAATLTSSASTFKSFIINSRGATPPNSDATLERYRVGGNALTQIAVITQNVNQVMNIAVFEQSMSSGTNPWADEDFRNGYDRLQTLTDIAGLSAAAIGAQRASGASIVTTGLATVALGRLLGAALGQQTGTKFVEKARFVELSRRAYDDLRARSELALSFSRANEALVADIARFRIRYDSAGGVGKEQLRRTLLLEAVPFLNRFDAVMLQIPTLLTVYKETIERYCPAALKVAATDPSNLGATECSSQLPGQTAPLVLRGKAREALQLAALQLHKLNDSRNSADEIRRLAPELRAALLGQ